MRTVQQLIDAGFSITPAEDAIGCSELFSPKIFHFYNPEHADGINDVYEALKTATKTDSGYRIVVAGRYGVHDAFPFNIIDEERRDGLDMAYKRYWDHTSRAKTAQDEFAAILRTGAPYATAAA